MLLQKVTFEALTNTLKDYHLYVLLAPHVRNAGFGNSGWAGDYKGVPMLFARRDDTFLALACSTPFLGMSCGYAGTSDGWQDVTKNGVMTWFYPDAEDGNIALTGEIDLITCGGEFVHRVRVWRHDGRSRSACARGAASGFRVDANRFCAADGRASKQIVST